MTTRKTTRKRTVSQLATGERGDGDFAPPPAIRRAHGRMRSIAQPREAGEPKITRRIIAVNFTPGRRREIDQVTVHVTEGSAASVVSWFGDPAAKASAHYQIRKTASDGGPMADIDQFVDENDKAWHNGRVFEPTAPLVLERPGVNPNEWSIGIEHEGSGTEEMTPQQRRSSQWLIRDIVRRRPRVQLDRRHIVGHHEVYGKKTCPGRIDVDRLVREIAAQTPMPVDAKTQPRVVWSDFFKDYLIVTRIESDTEWYFIRARNISGLSQTRAETPLSEMPREPG